MEENFDSSISEASFLLIAVSRRLDEMSVAGRECRRQDWPLLDLLLSVLLSFASACTTGEYNSNRGTMFAAPPPNDYRGWIGLQKCALHTCTMLQLSVLRSCCFCFYTPGEYNSNRGMMFTSPPNESDWMDRLTY